MHIWALKTQKLPGPLSGPWTPATECSLHSHDSSSLYQQLSASEAGAPLDQILDPHLFKYQRVEEFHMLAHIGCYCPPYLPPSCPHVLPLCPYAPPMYPLHTSYVSLCAPMHPLHVPMCTLHAPYMSPFAPCAPPMCPLHTPMCPYVPHTHSYMLPMHPTHPPCAPMYPNTPTHVPLCTLYVPLACFWLVNGPHHSQITGIDKPHFHKILIFPHRP